MIDLDVLVRLEEKTANRCEPLGLHAGPLGQIRFLLDIGPET